MKIFPAIDLFDNQAVRWYKGDYAQMTVYGDPVAFAGEFKACGAEYIHVVDLAGAKEGRPVHLGVVRKIVQTGLFVEVGGGIRDIETIQAYLSAGVGRVILGTSAVTDEAFLKEAVRLYGEKIAVGADVADAVYYFAAHARNTTGAELVVDGGNTVQLYPMIPTT